MTAWRAIVAVARVETLQLLRARMTFTLLFLVPALQVLLFGFAIRPTGAEISVAVAAPTAQIAAQITAALKSTPGLLVETKALQPGGAEARVREGSAVVGVEAGPDRSVRIVIDASNAARVSGAAAAIEAAYWRTLAAPDAGAIAGFRVERLYNADARADWTFLPALIGVTMMISAIMLGALSLARERETGTWETLLTLPLRSAEILAGKLIPHVAIGTLQGCLVLAAGVMIFKTPDRGNILALVALLPIYAAAHLVIGHAIAVRAASQLEALQGAVAFYLPAMLLSGFLYPFETLPPWARVMGEAFPLTHLIRAARGAMLRGDGAAEVMSHAPPILAVLGIALAVALLTRARRLD